MTRGDYGKLVRNEISARNEEDDADCFDRLWQHFEVDVVVVIVLGGAVHCPLSIEVVCSSEGSSS